MSIFLVRHASAGDRSQWYRNDLKRPLDSVGRKQSERIAAFLANAKLRTIWSSQATRCLQTIELVSQQHSLPIQVIPELSEGSACRQLWELLLEQASHTGDLVLCSHGDVISSTIERLHHIGLLKSNTFGCAKASIWELKTKQGEITEAIYTAAP